MNNIKIIYESILNEANSKNRIDFLKTKYKGVLENGGTDAEKFVANVVNTVDPTNGEYSEWIVRGYLTLTPRQQSRFDEDSYKITEDLKKYHKYKRLFKKAGYPQYADINQIKGNKKLDGSFENSFYVLTVIIDTVLGSLMEEEEEKESIKLAEKDVEKIYDSSNYLILIPQTEQASCAYGRGTRWCTAATGSRNYFNQYFREGPLYIIINKKTDEKYQFHFQSQQYMDKNDRDIGSIRNFFSENEEIRSVMAKEAFENGRIPLSFQIDPEGTIKNIKTEYQGDTTKLFELLSDSVLLTLHWGKREPEFVNSVLFEQYIKTYKAPYLKFESANTVSLYVDDFSDVSDFVDSKESRRKWEIDAAKKVLEGDYDTTYDYYPEYDSDLWDWLDETSINIVKKFIKDNYNEDLSDNESLREYVEENDIDEVISALRSASSIAHETAYNDELWKIVTDSLKENLGPYVWESIPEKNTSKLKFKLNVDTVIDSIDELRSYYSEGEDSTIRDFLGLLYNALHSSEKIEVPNLDRASHCWPSESEHGGIFNERFRENF